MALRTFAEVVALAQSKGGHCLSAPSDFVDTKSVLRFTCAVGHEWSTRVSNLMHRGRWCPECGAAHSPALTLKDVQRMAADRGGECLSRAYLGIHRKHLFRCDAGHVWEAQPANLRHRVGGGCKLHRTGGRNFHTRARWRQRALLLIGFHARVAHSVTGVAHHPAGRGGHCSPVAQASVVCGCISKASAQTTPFRPARLET